MRKILVLLLVLLPCSLLIRAQGVNSTNPVSQAKFEYYIRLSGVHSKQDVLFLQELIIKKDPVQYFMANRFPVRYFLLRTNRAVNAGEFNSWINNPAYHVDLFAEGMRGKEQAIVLYNKNKAP